MKRSTQKKLPPVLERYEMKYHIPPAMIAPISDFVSVYCSLDTYSLKKSHGFYRVTNLYLDTPNFLFLKMRREKVDNRFNMRVRAYGDPPGLPYFLEIKQKTGDIVRKFRSMVGEPTWHKTYTESNCREYEKEAEKDLAEEKNRGMFDRLIYSYNAEPKILTQYLRKAFISDVDDYARVTFDMDLRFRPENEYRIEAPEEEMTACDDELVFDPGCSVILELKCYTLHVPLWMIDLVRAFNLERRGFSKYKIGIEAAVLSDGIGYLPRVAPLRHIS